MPVQKISKPNTFKKFKVDKPKTKREDRIDEKEVEIVKWYQKDPGSTILFHAAVGFGISICFIAFDFDSRIIAKFLGASFISYMCFEELPVLVKRLRS